MKTIKDINFVDLYIGETYSDIKGLAGASASRVEAPEDLKDEIELVRQECARMYREQQDPEFALERDGVLYRVTYMTDIWGKAVFILRRSAAEVRPLASLGLPPVFLQTVLAKETRGLILIAGEMATGKTSTAASIIVQRLVHHGGIGVAVEDPPETQLNGIHGEGRCIQVRASRKSGGYKEHLIRAMRSGADLILIGEIRDAETAVEVIQASMNGHLIIATIHAADVKTAIERLASLSEAHFQHGTAYANLAMGLRAVLWQSLQSESTPNGTIRRLKCKTLIIDEHHAGVKTKIRNGEIAGIAQEIEEQSRQALWLRPKQSMNPN